jgi:hypothetical protein
MRYKIWIFKSCLFFVMLHSIPLHGKFVACTCLLYLKITVHPSIITNNNLLTICLFSHCLNPSPLLVFGQLFRPFLQNNDCKFWRTHIFFVVRFLLTLSLCPNSLFFSRYCEHNYHALYVVLKIWRYYNSHVLLVIIRIDTTSRKSLKLNQRSNSASCILTNLAILTQRKLKILLQKNIRKRHT